ncbi:HNH endonuclease [Halobacillus sp. A5]|uniref:HNH endonuclease n=1 Tax=Halobacillus sp. A5 TaxID=2880263 RepID=UPI00353258F6|nr:HNH endonuclease [Halobacillus sp. A5]
MRRDEYECRECRRYGRVTQAVIVHHIFPLENYSQYKLTDDNLYSCCNACHESFHNRFENELTDKGLKLQQRMKDKIINCDG